MSYIRVAKITSEWKLELTLIFEFSCHLTGRYIALARATTEKWLDSILAKSPHSDMPNCIKYNIPCLRVAVCCAAT